MSRCRIPFSARIRSNITSELNAPRPAGEHLAVLGEDPLGTPWARRLASSASHTARAVTRATSPAHTAEAGVVIDAGDHLDLPAVGQTAPPITSICHSSIARPRSQRR